MKLDNRLHQRETQAGSVGTARRFSAVKAIKNAWQMLGGDAAAVITHRHLEIAVVFGNRYMYGPVLRCESQRIVEALRARHVPVAYVLYPGEGHGFRNPKHIINSLQSELSFYGQVFGFIPADQLPPLSIEGLPGA